MNWSAMRIGNDWWLCCGEAHVARINGNLKPPGGATTDNGSGAEQWAKEAARLINLGLSQISTVVWDEPKHPGDSVRITSMRRGDEIGDIRIQWYEDKVMVATYLPGRLTPLIEGDTPKVEPECSAWFTLPGSRNHANNKFDAWVDNARTVGWTECKPNGDPL